jgi:multiple sugar transport system substrate-binding protein
MRRFWIVLPVVFALAASACTGGDSDDGGGGGATSPTGLGNEPVELTMWMGYTPPPPADESFEYLSIERMVDEFNQQNPNVTVNLQYVNSDFALQKATVALQGNKAPDISYQYGTNMPQLAQSPELVDLTDRVNEADFNWDDFFEGERAVATVDGRVLGIPALVDNLAIVYNKDLFQKAGLPEPTEDWTWADATEAAKAITDPDEKIFGLAFPADGSETMVWQYISMLWAAGGDILNPENTEAIFNSEAGVRALTTLKEINDAGAMYLDFRPDAGKYGELFNSGKIGMVITGPWDLSGFPDANYGVQFMPSFDPGGSHETIAGPDNWVIFDNGPERVAAAWEFLKFISSPEQVLKDSIDTGHLPTRASVEEMPEFSEFDKKYPGAGTFASNLVNVKKARPQIPQYPRISTALGQALANVLTGDEDPQAALDEAKEAADGILAVPA